MTAITAKMVGDLRAATGLGMMECKKALVEAAGDFTRAEELLRIKSGAKAGKLASRTATEGMIAGVVADNSGALVEINCETDFVAKDAGFKEFGQEVAAAIINSRVQTLAALADSPIAAGKTVEERRKEIIAKLGENITLRRLQLMTTERQLALYLHGVKIGVLVEYEGDGQTARDIAMHIAASKPQCVNAEEVDPELIEREKRIYTEQALVSGKPAAIAEKMVAGRVQKFLAEITLSGQNFVKNPDITVAELLRQKETRVFAFTVFQVGEGLEKKKVDYAAEVAAASRV